MEHYTALRYTFTSESRYGSGSKCGMLGDLVVQHVGGEHHQPAQEPLLALSLRSGHGRGVGGAHQEEDTCQQIKFIYSFGTNFRLLSVCLSKFRKYCIGIEMREQRLAKYLFDLSHDAISNQK